MKGPGQRIGLDIRRTFVCPECQRVARVPATQTAVLCGCKTPRVSMKLQESLRKLPPPNKSEPVVERLASEWLAEDPDPSDEIPIRPISRPAVQRAQDEAAVETTAETGATESPAERTGEPTPGSTATASDSDRAQQFERRPRQDRPDHRGGREDRRPNRGSRPGDSRPGTGASGDRRPQDRGPRGGDEPGSGLGGRPGRQTHGGNRPQRPDPGGNRPRSGEPFSAGDAPAGDALAGGTGAPPPSSSSPPQSDSPPSKRDDTEASFGEGLDA